MKILKYKLRETILVAVVVAIALAASFANENFLTLNNLSNIFHTMSTPGIMAIGMTLIIATGNIDISIGALFYTICVISAKLCIAFNGEYGLLIMLVGIVVGTLIGFINGILVAKLRIPAIVVTLATMNAIRGITLVIIDGAIITGLTGKFVKIAAIKLGPLFISPFIWLILFGLAYIMLYHTTVGRKILAVGDNPVAAARVGISNERIYILVFTIAGFLAGIAGPLYTSKIGTINTVVGLGYEMKLIAAAVIGGTAFSGGTASLFGTFCGIAIVGFTENMLVMMQVPTYWQQTTTGAILLVAVVSSAFQFRLTIKASDSNKNNGNGIGNGNGIRNGVCNGIGNDNDNNNKDKDKIECTGKGVSESD
ncbi:MAG: ABC transporter permease [Oscillospiraceae bacterium]|nr:ABC transporter permease [Oscillospiraceae bacterium]